jgi:antitoxin (DNA-binding transcriptional repressor) of toxin-antitoxin stability system
MNACYHNGGSPARAARRLRAKLYVKTGRSQGGGRPGDHPWSQGRACARLLAVTSTGITRTAPLSAHARGRRGEGSRAHLRMKITTIRKNLKRSRKLTARRPSCSFREGPGYRRTDLLPLYCTEPNWSQLALPGSPAIPRLGGMTCAGRPCCGLLPVREKRMTTRATRCRTTSLLGPEPRRHCPDGFMALGSWMHAARQQDQHIDSALKWFSSRSNTSADPAGYRRSPCAWHD